jgi:hypothetical protein
MAAPQPQYSTGQSQYSIYVQTDWVGGRIGWVVADRAGHVVGEGWAPDEPGAIAQAHATLDRLTRPARIARQIRWWST